MTDPKGIVKKDKHGMAYLEIFRDEKPIEPKEEQKEQEQTKPKPKKKKSKKKTSKNK